MAKLDVKTFRAARRLLVRGESLVASTGLAVAAILVVLFVCAATWVLYAHRQAARETTQAQAQGWAELMARTAEPLIEEGRYSELRSVVVAFAVEKQLEYCRIIGGGGEALAASLAELEASGRGVSATAPIGAGGLSGTGPRVELARRLIYPSWAGWQMQAGLGMIGIAAMVAFLFVYRHLRSRLRAIGAIREALLAMERGERESSALSVSAALGAEANAWNQLLGERERLQKELLSEKARETLGGRGDLKQDLAQACDALWQGLLLVDEDLKIKYANGAAAVFLRGRRETLPGTLFTAYIDDQATVDAVRAVATGELRCKSTIELRRTEAQGGGILRLSVRPVRRDDAASAVVVVEDITQQRIADEARNAFVAQTTHELRTPLTNIRLYVEQAIELGDGEPAQRAKCLNVINQESRRLERIVGDMLSVSEIEAGSFKLRAGDVRLDALFEGLQEEYAAQAAEKKVELLFDLPPKLPVIQADRDKLMLALHNLIGNALKYTPEGGVVTVRVVADGRSLTVEVQDTGIGIAPDEAELIFERFYRSKDQRLSAITGTGLGLTLAREVIRLHGGEISVRSQVDQGSTFTLTVPVLAKAA
jgi:signal transduction histidine kinase